MRSTRSISAGRTRRRRQGGFALISALVLAILYFALMELLLIDSSRALHEAQRFRARVVAMTVAENAAELAATNMVGQYSNVVPQTDDAQGSMKGDYSRSASPSVTGSYDFQIHGEGTNIGVVTEHATVFLEGQIESGTVVKIRWSRHSL